jgi:predicted permease
VEAARERDLACNLASGGGSVMNWWWFRTRRQNDIERELRMHLQLEEAEQRESDKTTQEEAQYAARRAFGNVTRIAEDTRAVWTFRWLEDLIGDLRFAMRTFRRKPGIAVLIVLILALGTGANTAIFSVVNTVLVKPLPYQDASRVITIWNYNRQRGFDTEQVSPPDYADWRARNHSFSEMGASVDEMYTLTGRGTPVPLIAYSFSSNFFRVLGVAPVLGRTFSPEEEHSGKNMVAILSYQLWQTRFGGDQKVLGQTAILDGIPHTVIGVMPQGVTYPGSTELWTPLVIRPESATNRGDRFLRVLGRLRSGVTQQQAASDMNAIAKRLAREYPATNKEVAAVNLISLRRAISGDISSPLLLLMCAVGFVLLIACANVANLLLVRNVSRRGEVAVRLAIGAGRDRLFRQFLTESLLLAFAGALCGVALALACVGSLLALFPQNVANLSIPHLERIPIDGSVLSFALLVCFATGLLFGLLPALELMRAETSVSLKESSRKVAGTQSGGRMRDVLTGFEVSVSVVLLVAAGLMLKSFSHLIGGNIGVNPDHVLTLRLVLPADKYSSKPKLLAFSDQLLSRLQHLPGVRSSATVTFLPLSGWRGSRPVIRKTQTAANAPTSMWSSISPDYFRTMQIPVLAGRIFDRHDNGSSTRVAVISQSLARRVFPGGDPVGESVDAGFDSPLQIVGVVGDVHHLGMTSDLTSEIYVPFEQFPFPLLCIAMRTEGEPMALAQTVEKQVWALDANQAVSFLMPMTALASETLSVQRVITTLLTGFAGLALLMAIAGIYAVISFSAAQRTQEIGVRLALGARAADVLKMIAGQAAPPVLIGLVAGVGAALGLVHLLTAFLYGVGPFDPLVFVGVAAVIIGAAVLASYLPARRAIRIDPMTALRYE